MLALLMPASSLSWRSSSATVVVVLLGPLDVHPQQHLGPIVGVGAAVAGVDRQDRPVPIVRTVQQDCEFQGPRAFFQPLDFRGHLGCERLVLLRHFHMDPRSAAGRDRRLSTVRRSISDDFSCATVSWARSWLSQKSGAAISVPASRFRFILLSWSKSVSELEDPLLNRFGAIVQFLVHVDLL